MREFYIDTNVFISRYKSDDPYHSEARAITRGLEKDEIRAETSALTLLETASVASRMYQTLLKDGGTRVGQGVFVIKLLRKLSGLKVKFINIPGDVPVTIRNIQANIPSIFNEAILLSTQTALRTFDLIHIASARYAKQINNELGAFVTGDGELLNKKEGLSRIIGMPILSPSQYVEGLGLRVYEP